MDFWRVTWTEHERGWGSKTDDVQYYTDADKAHEAAKKTNDRNVESSAPDYYVTAQVDKIAIPDELVALIISVKAPVKKERVGKKKTS